MEDFPLFIHTNPGLPRIDYWHWVDWVSLISFGIHFHMKHMKSAYVEIPLYVAYVKVLSLNCMRKEARGRSRSGVNRKNKHSCDTIRVKPHLEYQVLILLLQLTVNFKISLFSSLALKRRATRAVHSPGRRNVWSLTMFRNAYGGVIKGI